MLEAVLIELVAVDAAELDTDSVDVVAAGAEVGAAVTVGSDLITSF